MRVAGFVLLLLATPLRAETVREVIPGTISNLHGHAVLYDEGWRVVTSTKDALDYAYDHGVTQSSQAMSEMKKNLATTTSEYQAALSTHGKEARSESERLRVSIGSAGQTAENDLRETSKELGADAIELRKDAFSSFVVGYVELGARTKDDLAELKKRVTPSLGKLGDDYANDVEFYGALEREEGGERASLWKRSFALANEDVQREYAASGKQPNALLGLWRLGAGYVRASFDGIFHPGAVTIAAATSASLKMAGRTVLATGESFFYASKIGYKVVSPTVESGLLASLSLVAWTSGKALAGTSEGLHAVNRVAVVSSEPVAYGGKWLLATTGETAKVAALSTYEVGKGVGSVVVNTTSAAVVLGYNAVTALPTHAALGAANAVYFLGWDGPWLVVYTVEGKINGVPANALPVGTVVDVDRLRAQKVEVKDIQASPAELEKVLRESAKDLRR